MSVQINRNRDGAVSHLFLHLHGALALLEQQTGEGVWSSEGRVKPKSCQKDKGRGPESEIIIPAPSFILSRFTFPLLVQNVPLAVLLLI